MWPHSVKRTCLWDYNNHLCTDTTAYRLGKISESNSIHQMFCALLGALTSREHKISKMQSLLSRSSPSHVHQDTQIIRKSRKQSVYQQRRLSAEGAWRKFVELLAAASNKDYQYSPNLQSWNRGNLCLDLHNSKS